MNTAANADSAVFILSAEGWVAFWTMALTFTTCALVVVGFVQLKALREDAVLGRTLNQCDKYQMDPIIDASLRRLASSWLDGSIKIDPVPMRPDIITILNYLDSLAFGCFNGIYLEDFVRTHMRPIFDFHFEQYMGTSRLHVAGLDLEDYVHIQMCRDRWSRPRAWHRRVNVSVGPKYES